MLWSEWNGKYRDVTRDYWRSQEATLGEFAARLTGSADLYQDDGRKPYASINFVTAHDGFTLHDLVSYNEKHNEANGEDNRDGESHNRSWNLGAEGPTDDPEVNARRARQQRNFLATLLLSQGVPMMLGGDEIGRTQQGNNNAYCQDNEISWFDWDHADRDLLEFTRRLIAFRREHPVFRRRGWFKGQPIRGQDASDITWFKPDGTLMSEQDWTEWFAKSFVLFLNGDALRSRDERGRPMCDDTFLVLFNAHLDPVTFTLPATRGGSSGYPCWTRRWSTDFTTTRPSIRADPSTSWPVCPCRFSGAADGILPAEAGSHMDHEPQRHRDTRVRRVQGTAGWDSADCGSGQHQGSGPRAQGSGLPGSGRSRGASGLCAVRASSRGARRLPRQLHRPLNHRRRLRGQTVRRQMRRIHEHRVVHVGPGAELAGRPASTGSPRARSGSAPADRRRA